jgi:hypothetical protein
MKHGLTKITAQIICGFRMMGLTTQEKQHYSSPGDSHHPLIWSETLNRSRQSNPHFAYLHAKQSNVYLYPRVFLGHQPHHSEATYKKKLFSKTILHNITFPFSATDTKKVLYEKNKTKKDPSSL